MITGKTLPPHAPSGLMIAYASPVAVRVTHKLKTRLGMIMVLRKFIALIAVILATSVQSADLQLISESRDGNETWFLKKDRVTKAGNYYSLWVYVYLKHPAKATRRSLAYVSSTANWLADCTEGKLAFGQTILYDAEENTVAQFSGNEFAFSRPVPDTHADAVLRAVCLMVDRPIQ